MFASIVRRSRGIGPLQAAHLAGRLSAEVSTALADELSGPRGALLPLPNLDGTDPTIDLLKEDIKALGGGLAFVESQAVRSDQDQHQPVPAGSRGGSARNPVRFKRSGKAGVRVKSWRLGLSTSLWFDADGASKRDRTVRAYTPQ